MHRFAHKREVVGRQAAALPTDAAKVGKPKLPRNETNCGKIDYVHCDLGLLEMAIHCGIHAYDGSLNNGPILELDGHLLSIELL